LRRSVICFFHTVLLGALFAASAVSQTAKTQKIAPADSDAVVTGVKAIFDNGAAAIEVVSTRPVTPTVQMLDSPPRLVIDLAHAQLGLPRKKIPVQKENILTIRAEQYQIEPAITRIVVDLLIPYGYTWDSAGNRLTVRLKPLGDAAAADKSQPPQLAALSIEATPAAVPVSNGVGEFVLAGKAFADGSSLTAGSDTAVLRLTRGGEVRVCPGTTVSVTPSKTSKNLMLGLSTGSLEAHYSLKETADTVLTPDFRILFAGPGEFHYAVSADAHGNTCVRGLKGNTSAAIVYEIMSDRIYQVKPSEQLVFHSGRIDQVDGNVPPECGCPPPPLMRTDSSSKPSTAPEPAGSLTLAQSASSQTTGTTEGSAQGNRAGSTSPKDQTPQTLSSGPEVRPLPPSQANDVRVQVDVPLVYQGKQKPESAPAPQTTEIASAPASASQAPVASAVTPATIAPQLQPPAAPAAPPAKPEHRGVLKRIKGFFTSIFG
jgi:hypothetical protein